MFNGPGRFELHFTTLLTGNFWSYQLGDHAVDVPWLLLKEVLGKSVVGEYCPVPNQDP